MYRLLRNKSTIERGTRQPPSVHDTYARVRTGVEDAKVWLREQAFTVDSDHPLLSALLLLAPDPKMDLLEYHSLMAARVTEVARSMDASTTVFVGKLRKESFLYGKGYTEAIVATEFNYNLMDAEVNWESWKSLRIRQHPVTELSVPSFLTMNQFKETGRVVLEVDLVALAVQYRQWFLKWYNPEEDSIPSVRRFITDYPLVNAIEDHINVAVFNRLLGILNGNPLADHQRLIPNLVIDYTKRVDRYLLDRNSLLIDGPGHYEYMMDTVLLPYGDIWDMIKLPSVGINRQTTWVINLIRMRVFEWLVKIDYMGFRSNNGHHRNLIRRAIISAGNNGTFKDAMGGVENTALLKYLDESLMIFM